MLIWPAVILSNIMSTVTPIPVMMITTVVVLVVLDSLGVPELTAIVAASGVGLVAALGWTASDRLPNGGGAM